MNSLAKLALCSLVWAGPNEQCKTTSYFWLFTFTTQFVKQTTILPIRFCPNRMRQTGGNIRTKFVVIFVVQKVRTFPEQYYTQRDSWSGYSVPVMNTIKFDNRSEISIGGAWIYHTIIPIRKLLLFLDQISRSRDRWDAWTKPNRKMITQGNNQYSTRKQTSDITSTFCTNKQIIASNDIIIWEINERFKNCCFNKLLSLTMCVQSTLNV